jgi:hypothetical protein
MSWLEGNRKLVLALVFSVSGVVALLTNQATWVQFSEFIVWIWGIYVGGNVGERVAKAVGKKNGVAG